MRIEISLRKSNCGVGERIWLVNSSRFARGVSERCRRLSQVAGGYLRPAQRNLRLEDGNFATLRVG